MRILVADGIGTKGKTSQVIDDAVRRLVSKTGGRAIWIEWPASMMGVGGVLSWEESTRVGVEKIYELLQDSDDDIVLMGYSGGCRVVREFLRLHPQYHIRVRAVGLMSDWMRPQGKHQHGTPVPRGYGLGGQDEGPLPDRTFYSALDGDVVTSATEDAILRTVTDSSHLRPDQVLGSLVHNVGSGNFQLAWKLGQLQKNPLAYLTSLGPRLHQARLDIRGYLYGGHTNAYTEPIFGGDSMSHRLGETLAVAYARRRRDG